MTFKLIIPLGDLNPDMVQDIIVRHMNAIARGVSDFPTGFISNPHIRLRYNGTDEAVAEKIVTFYGIGAGNNPQGRYFPHLQALADKLREAGFPIGEGNLEIVDSRSGLHRH